MSKDVTILHTSGTGLSATNAKEINVWKKVGNSYVFSHVEKLKPTHTVEELANELTAKSKNEKE